MDYISSLANNVLKQFGTNDPFEIASILNIEIIIRSFSNNLKGIFVQDNKTAKHIIILNSKLNYIMKKFVLSHELGHAFLHPDTSRYFIESHTLFSPCKLEMQANKFAAALLIDDNVLLEFIERGESIEILAYELEVPVELIRFKLEKADNIFFR